MPQAAAPQDTEAALARWARSAGCRLLVLFGSQAEGRAHARSDLDLALDFAVLPDASSRLTMIGELHDLCGGLTPDVVFLRPETSPVLRFEVFRTGRPLHEGRPGLFVSETVRALAIYEDALPFRRLLKDRVTG